MHNRRIRNISIQIKIDNESHLKRDADIMPSPFCNIGHCIHLVSRLLVEVVVSVSWYVLGRVTPQRGGRVVVP